MVSRHAPRVSFLDERDNPPRGPGRSDGPPSDPGPGEPAPGARSRGRPPGGPHRPGRGTDRQTLLVRRGLAMGAGLVLIIAAAFLVRGCLDARQERAFEDYVQETSSLVSESGQEGESLFELLEDPGELTAVEVQNSVNGLSVDAERLVERAEEAEPPDELSDAHAVIIQSLDLRRQGLEALSQELPTALGDEEREEAVQAIAFDMQTFLASDVIYNSQAVPVIEETLVEQGLPAQIEELPEGDFLPSIEWLQRDRVEEAIDEIPTSEADTGEDEAAQEEAAPAEEAAPTEEATP